MLGITSVTGFYLVIETFVLKINPDLPSGLFSLIANCDDK